MPADQNTIGVCGFGRCGSTMAMQMLVAGGVRPVEGAEQPPHELPDYGLAWAAPLTGRCIKILDLFRHQGFPPARWRFLWLDRDPLQQARSQVKFFQMIMPGLITDTDDSVDQFAASYGRDRPRAIAQLHGEGRVLVLNYEHVLADPLYAARRMRAALWPDLDVEAAAAVVHDRDGTCRPDLAVEAAITLASRQEEADRAS